MHVDDERARLQPRGTQPPMTALGFLTQKRTWLAQIGKPIFAQPGNFLPAVTAAGKTP